MNTNENTARMAQISLDRIHTILAQLTWSVQTLNTHEMPEQIDNAICELTKLAEIVKTKHPNQLILNNVYKFNCDVRNYR